MARQATQALLTGRAEQVQAFKTPRFAFAETLTFLLITFSGKFSMISSFPRPHRSTGAMDYTSFVFPRNTKSPTRQAPQIVRPRRAPTQAFPLVGLETFLPDVFMLGIDHTRLH